jgi:ABC-type multidrug transport system fused ATPase/permease subunit
MLYKQLGIVFVAPMGVAIVCFVGLGILIRFTGDSQRSWMSGVQKRVGLTATVIGSMKSLKISGLSAPVSSYVQQLRVKELASGARFRKIVIIAALFAFMPQLISPPLTFAFAQGKLDASTMFTSLSFLTLLSNPLSQLFQSIPELVSGLACLGRIQAFLECEPRRDFRQVLADTRKLTEKTTANTQPLSESISEGQYSLVIQDANFGWNEEKFTLQNMNTRISKSSLTMIIGPVGSGKSTFCKAILGEIPFSKGDLIISTPLRHVGFCEQTAFLSNGTIRENIIGYSQFYPDRYAEVIEAAALGFDFANLPQGDRTNIGSDGIALSGGQKQRVSLARALYLNSDLLLLDDIFSGLDADTEEQVFRQVFGASGLLRKRNSTVILCTHSIRHLPAADYIIALQDGVIAEQGTFRELTSREGYVQSLGLNDTSECEPSRDQPASKAGICVSKSTLTETTIASGSRVSLAPDMVSSRQVGDATVYKHYLRSMGWFVAGCSMFFAVLWGFFTNYPTICEFLAPLFT